MISIDSSHPDVPEFIELKTDLEKVTKANISIRIHEDFMEAVKIISLIPFIIQEKLLEKLLRRP